MVLGYVLGKHVCRGAGPVGEEGCARSCARAKEGSFPILCSIIVEGKPRGNLWELFHPSFPCRPRTSWPIPFASGIWSSGSGCYRKGSLGDLQSLGSALKGHHWWSHPCSSKGGGVNVAFLKSKCTLFCCALLTDHWGRLPAMIQVSWFGVC